MAIGEVKGVPTLYGSGVTTYQTLQNYWGSVQFISLAQMHRLTWLLFTVTEDYKNVVTEIVDSTEQFLFM